MRRGAPLPARRRHAASRRRLPARRRVIRRSAFRAPAPRRTRPDRTEESRPIAGAGVLLRVQLSAGRTPERILRLKDGSIRAYVAVPRERGLANRRLIQLLSRLLEVHRDDVQIVSGTWGARKLVRIGGRTHEDVDRLIPDARPGHYTRTPDRPARAPRRGRGVRPKKR